MKYIKVGNDFLNLDQVDHIEDMNSGVNVYIRDKIFYFEGDIATYIKNIANSLQFIFIQELNEKLQEGKK